MGQRTPHWKKIKLACSTHRVYHHIELEQGFPKPVAKVPELFGRGFYGRWKIEEIGSRPAVGTGTTKYRLYPSFGINVEISRKKPLIFPGNLREISRFSRGHKNLVRKLQKLLRPVLESPARALSDGILCA